jgi:hypothetical protein
MRTWNAVMLPGTVLRTHVNFGVHTPKSCRPTLGRRASFMTKPKVGMYLQCTSIRAKGHPEERCSCKALDGDEWCGRHLTQKDHVRYVEKIQHVIAPLIHSFPKNASAAATIILRAWNRWIARRAGPLLHFRKESNNPFDFFSSDPVEEISIRDFISFVDKGKGYIMDVKSATSLLKHAKKSGEESSNPFNRAPLPVIFYRRLALHRTTSTWKSLEGLSEAQKLSLATTDTFRAFEDLGYYTDPQWFIDLTPQQLQRLYIELADIWYHRAGLNNVDKARIVPGKNPFPIPVSTVLIMKQKALRPLLLDTCKTLVSTATAKSDKQLGLMYVIGSLAIVSSGAAVAYPWLVDMFSPGVSRIVGGSLQILHPSVMAY